MSDKIAVVYIGDKPSKKDTVTGSRLVFPRHTPVDVESHIAMQLLEFPTVWIRHEALAGELERQETTAQAAAEEKELLAAEQARLAEEQSMVVGERDLAKMTSAQLATLVEGEDLDIEPQGPQEKVPEYRVRVRDALKAKLEQGRDRLLEIHSGGGRGAQELGDGHAVFSQITPVDGINAVLVVYQNFRPADGNLQRARALKGERLCAG